MDMSSSLSSMDVFLGPIQISSTFAFLVPLGPTIVAIAPWAIKFGIPSPLGAALHKFPPSEARP